MNYAREVSSLALSIRKKKSNKSKTTIKKNNYSCKKYFRKKSIESVSELICLEINVKKTEIIDDSSGIIVKYVKPNLKILGPKYGSKINELKNELEALQKNQIELLEKEIISLNIFDEKINIHV